MTSLLTFLPVASRMPDYARLVAALVLDERMPIERKLLLGVAAGYIVLGRDIVPDDVPVLGGVDDLIVVAFAVDLFLDGVPRDLLEEKLRELEIDRSSYDRDIAQIRRLMPGPVRRTIRRIPVLIHGVGAAISESDLVPRLRNLVAREDPIS
jgi:uncharacterized membrane protein YkvA (DUF1232 family)